MGVDHGCFYILVAEQFLDGADVVAGFEKVGGEGMPEYVRGDAFVYFCEAGGIFDGFLEVGFMEMMALPNARARVFG